MTNSIKVFYKTKLLDDFKFFDIKELIYHRKLAKKTLNKLRNFPRNYEISLLIKISWTPEDNALLKKIKTQFMHFLSLESD